MGIRGVGLTAAIAIAGWTACSALDDTPATTGCYDHPAGGKDPPSLWTELKPAGGPAPRTQPSFALDEANDRAIVFGGSSSTSSMNAMGRLREARRCFTSLLLAATSTVVDMQVIIEHELHRYNCVFGRHSVHNQTKPRSGFV